MVRAHHVIDSDGHILEPLMPWNDYMDLAFRDRAPKPVKDKDGKERLLVEEQILGQPTGHGRGRRAAGCRLGRNDELRGGSPRRLRITASSTGLQPSGRLSMWPQPAFFAQYSQVRQVSAE